MKDPQPLNETKRPGRSPRSPSVAEAQLMPRVRAGEAGALDGLVRQHWSCLVGYAHRMLGSDDEAKDVAQEVFIRAWESRERWQSGGSERAFLIQVARNLCLQRLRRARVRLRSRPEVGRGSKERPQTPMDEVYRGELRQALRRALGCLPDRRREAFVLVRVDGLSLGAAAKRMGVTKRTVANHIDMARCNLRQTLQSFAN